MQAGLGEFTEVVQGDFHKMPFEDASFDAVFSVEATCHAGKACCRPDSANLRTRMTTIQSHVELTARQFPHQLAVPATPNQPS
jgi:Methyltransferase domain